MNSRRQYLYHHTHWFQPKMPPVRLFQIVNLGLVTQADGTPYPFYDWFADTQQAEADAKDEAATLADVRNGGCQ